MKQRVTPLLALLLAIIALPASAAATTLPEIGALDGAKPGCPGFAPNDCLIVMVRQTGFQVKVGSTKAMTTAKQSGSLVAWTIPVAAVSDKGVKSLNSSYGGAPRVALVVLNPLGKSKFQVVQKGPLIDLTPYLGTSPTFALPALPIKKGQVIAITVPTWAPVIQLGLGGDTSWRSSRPLKESVAKNFTTQRALVGDTTTGFFGALYQRARLTYSATFVPPAAKVKTTTTKK